MYKKNVRIQRRSKAVVSCVSYYTHDLKHRLGYHSGFFYLKLAQLAFFTTKQYKAAMMKQLRRVKLFSLSLCFLLSLFSAWLPSKCPLTFSRLAPCSMVWVWKEMITVSHSLEDPKGQSIFSHGKTQCCPFCVDTHHCTNSQGLVMGYYNWPALGPLWPGWAEGGAGGREQDIMLEPVIHRVIKGRCHCQKMNRSGMRKRSSEQKKERIRMISCLLQCYQTY